ncbi:hypothetical protein SAMN02910298_01475 [Pseudobutyrivibrio sp. YE44]|uniref:J domain-containing protein n=1 Tax=Pseudobutyrivibrio sp. YE44 TaxID=1520802 RepID=UPI0008858F0C|nr:J domain-containing protein [Pseudobutyrivibrio sp. YE44]SDB30004.1 hypothetical protein SAMN02910298_01475 [Pseudobutyrivibrio sp. YE44]
MSFNYTCQETSDMRTFNQRQRDLEKAWNDLLMEKRDVEARRYYLEKEETVFAMKWDMLVRETRQLAVDKNKFERKKKFYEYVNSNAYDSKYEDTYEQEVKEKKIVRGEMFFSGVTTRSELRKRYRDLIKIYHPDGAAGDTETVAEINREYENLKAQMY